MFFLITHLGVNIHKWIHFFLFIYRWVIFIDLFPDLFTYVIYLCYLFSGCCYSKPLLVPGGRAFVWPVGQQIQRFFFVVFIWWINTFIVYCRISLNTMTLQVESPTVYTSQGVPISVTGIAQVLEYFFHYYCVLYYLFLYFLFLYFLSCIFVLVFFCFCIFSHCIYFSYCVYFSCYIVYFFCCRLKFKVKTKRCSWPPASNSSANPNLKFNT